MKLFKLMIFKEKISQYLKTITSVVLETVKPIDQETSYDQLNDKFSENKLIEMISN